MTEIETTTEKCMVCLAEFQRPTVGRGKNSKTCGRRCSDKLSYQGKSARRRGAEMPGRGVRVNGTPRMGE